MSGQTQEGGEIVEPVKNGWTDTQSQDKIKTDKMTVKATVTDTNFDEGNVYNTFVTNASFTGTKLSGTSQTNQIIDILMDYPWTIEKFSQQSQQNNGKNKSSNAHKIADVPFCYVTEWQQKTSSNIMNIINSIVAASTSISNLIGNFKSKDANDKNIDVAGNANVKKLSSMVSNMRQKLFNSVNQDKNADTQEKPVDNNQTASFVSGMISGVQGAIDDFNTWLGAGLNVNNPTLGSKFLKPYSMLYSLDPTNKKYCFPMVANPPKMSTDNEFVDSDDASGFLNNMLFNAIPQFATNVAKTARDFSDILNTFTGGKYFGSAVEKAKYYQFPQRTQEYRISFPLLNTVNAGDWKKNYRFILLFMLRNMVFRKDNASFYPPLFYDLVIPGVVRHPFCYVGHVEARPVGAVRTLGYDELTTIFKDNTSIMGQNNNLSVNVPEAWIVTITFKTLLSTSANMVLSGLVDMQINTERSVIAQPTEAKK